ncbi:hypothetical protein GO684_01460 [Wolbachia endosymbiont of Litomosoides brasiliensis]|nr:hypothetical protein [Wolbachia endosymbiont of Litomosoides brasiliensis]NUY39372.1 hypothetical protein [Wolbachia endosymbiont of Litomosoides brasiliensis]
MVKETLNKVQNNAYVTKKLNAVIAEKTQYSGCSKNMLYFKNSIDHIGKALKF